ncbi:hypothetical protein L7F22_002331 [Adiantum nelumboides]|nr:hypothetical protein [Adiantum nelumboides]
MLLRVGCQPTSRPHKLRSNENLLESALHANQLNRFSWRKLLEENVAANLNGIKKETVNASATIEPKNADEPNATTNVPGESDVQDVKKDSVAIDVKKEEEKPDPAFSIAVKKEGAAHDDANKVEEPKIDVIQESSNKGDEVEHKDTYTADKDKVEVFKIEPNVHSQAAQIEERSPTSVNGSITNDQQEPADDQTSDKSQASGETKPQDNLANESTSLTVNTDAAEELAEVKPIKMVANTSNEVKQMNAGDTDKVVLTFKPETVVTEQTAYENASALSEEKEDKPNNSTDGASEVTSNIGDSKVEDEKVEDKNESVKVKEEESEDGTIVELQGDSGEKEEEKQEVSDYDSDKQSESKGTESNEEKADESQDSSGGNVETKDEESEESSSKDMSLVAKTDAETEAATQEVQLQLEALKRGTMIETTVEQMKERDLSEDEYDIIHELADLPTKFQETAGKVADHLRPDVMKWKDTSKVYFNFANQRITESFSPLIGKQYAPFFASMISYGILLLPLIVVIVLFDHIKALFSLQKVLLFINIYLAAYFATLWLASFIIGLEPMSFFYLNSLSSYLSLQLLQGLGYFVYLTLQTANVFHSFTSDTLAGKLTSALQWTVAMAIGLHYYVTVFHPAIASKPPHTSWKSYAVYTAAFFVLCLFARIKWVKKQYVIAGSNINDKKS